MLDGIDYWNLWDLFNANPPYAGYRPNVAEIPNGDGKVDADKRYLHVALKYDPPEYAKRLLCIAHGAALEVAEALNVPRHLFPSLQHGALRVLEYPAGVGGERHTDFDLFTVNLYRTPMLNVGASQIAGYSVHIGELGELAGLGPAQPHQIPALKGEQYSLVYFAIPDHDASIRTVIDPCGPNHYVRVGDWLDERIKRSRAYK